MVDFLIDEETGDLLIKNNDLAIGDSNPQTVQDILQTVPGEYKFYPYVGCDIWRFLNGSATLDEIKNTVKKQLEIQKFTVFDVVIETNNSQVNIMPVCERV